MSRKRVKRVKEPPAHYSLSRHGMTRCQSNDDGDCDWKHCPQLRDGEPDKSGRHCPHDIEPTTITKGRKT